MKSLWKVSVATTLEAEDAVAEMLADTFVQPAASFFDVEKQTSIVSVFLTRPASREEHQNVRDGWRRIRRSGLKAGAGKVFIRKIRPRDWAESWKRHFKPIEIFAKGARADRSGKRAARGRTAGAPSSLLVKPSWSKRRPRKDQSVVVLDPGLSFGTGRHPTTAFCLREIVTAAGKPMGIGRKTNAAFCRRAATKKSFLDIGTGSGILAIAAAKLGFKPVRAFDFDPEAVRVAKTNARTNRVDGKIQIVRGDVTRLPLHPGPKYDLICANLISNLLIAERKRIAAQLNKNGSLVLAGILKREFAEVRRAFEKCGLKCVAARSEKEWKSGSFRPV